MTPRSTPLHRLRTVAQATRAAVANPEDTSQVFRIAEAMSFRNPERMLRRFTADPTGARLLAARDQILPRLQDRAWLESLPVDSLGAAYLRFIDAEGITADGLVAASRDGADPSYYDPDSDLGFVRQRMRDSHDLWHALTGYKGDLLGETSLLAFTFAQTRHPGIGFLAGLGIVFTPHANARRMIRDGFRRGRRAAWLPTQDWAALLPRPLDEVRRELRVDVVPDYEPVRQRPEWLRRATA